jgi:hypothetical protein
MVPGVGWPRSTQQVLFERDPTVRHDESNKKSGDGGGCTAQTMKSLNKEVVTSWDQSFDLGGSSGSGGPSEDIVGLRFIS